MSVDLTMLAWSVLLGLGYVFVAAGFVTHQRGLKWNAGNRDSEARPLTGIAVRANSACHNFLETFPFFAAGVLTVALVQRQSPHTALGAELYFWARVVYLPVYLIGIPYLRTAVWAVSVWGLLQVIEALF